MRWPAKSFETRGRPEVRPRESVRFYCPPGRKKESADVRGKEHADHTAVSGANNRTIWATVASVNISLINVELRPLPFWAISLHFISRFPDETSSCRSIERLQSNLASFFTLQTSMPTLYTLLKVKKKEGFEISEVSTHKFVHSLLLSPRSRYRISR